VVHRYDDRFFRIAVHDSFKTDFLSSHSKQQLQQQPSASAYFLACKPEGLINTRNKS
jgi:hypothetical protein